MSNPTIWHEELRDLPRDGSAAAVWVLRREGDHPEAPLRLLCGWSTSGTAAPVPLGLVLQVLRTGRPAEQRDEGRERRPPLSRALPLTVAGRIGGVLVAAATDRAPWRLAIQLWAEGVAARLGPMLAQLEPWPGTWLGPEPRAPSWQPSLFSAEQLPPPRPPASAGKGMLLPRPRAVAGLPGAVGRSIEMRQLAGRVRDVASSDVNVLLHGETGTGKEIVARALHDGSGRASGPFVGLNCAALPENLFESELFGHKAGAFTGASRDKPGLLESAHGGTFFMDEIGDMPLPLQIKLLRVMQERRVRRVGELESRPVDIRFLAATHKNLSGEIEAGRFRLDLYYRLKVVQLDIPPLRQRPEDVLPLLAHFLRRAGSARGDWAISDGAVSVLHGWRWPGNVRELENEASRLVALHGQEPVIRRQHLSWEIQTSAGPRLESDDLGTLRRLEEASEILERHLIRKAIAASAGRKSVAARTLGLSRQGLYKKITRYGMTDLIASQADRAPEDLARPAEPWVEPALPALGGRA
jgi:transcriptional regulator with AAA-type ATPase domain